MGLDARAFLIADTVDKESGLSAMFSSEDTLPEKDASIRLNTIYTNFHFLRNDSSNNYID